MNEHAGNGKGRATWRELQRSISTSYHCEITNYSTHATKIARSICESTSESIVLIVVGGDGTIHEVVNGVIGFEHVTIGVVKAGSGNDFSRTFPTFLNALEIDLYMKNRKQLAMDSGQLQLNQNTFHFVNNAGIGLDAYITLLQKQSRSKRWLNKLKLGRLIYTWTLFRALFTFQRFHLQIMTPTETKKFRDVWLATFCNQRYFGGGMNISPSSEPNDGEMELVIVHRLPPVKLLLLFCTVFLGKHTRFPEVEMLKGRQFHLKIEGDVPYHADGEYLGNTTFNEHVTCTILEKTWYVIEKNR